MTESNKESLQLFTSFKATSLKYCGAKSLPNEELINRKNCHRFWNPKTCFRIVKRSEIFWILSKRTEFYGLELKVH